jgi:hypothetical protein
VSEHPPDLRPESNRGCLAAALGSVALVVFSPFVLLIRSWQSWRRGDDLRTGVDLSDSNRPGHVRIDVRLDVPRDVEPGFRRRLTDTVVRVAEALHSPDDVYHLVYRLASDAEPMAMPVGPRLQELGDRFSLVSSQSALSGRTVVWLTLPRGRALSDVLDPHTYDPEADGEPERLLEHGAAHWSMASEWAQVGPSLVIRLVVIVPAARADRIDDLLRDLAEKSATVK